MTSSFPTQISDGYVHFSGATHVWTFPLGYFAATSEHVEITRDAVLCVRAQVAAMLRAWCPPGVPAHQRARRDAWHTETNMKFALYDPTGALVTTLDHEVTSLRDARSMANELMCDPTIVRCTVTDEDETLLFDLRKETRA